MKKGFRETMLQLVLSPVNLFLNDNYQVVSQFCLVVCVWVGEIVCIKRIHTKTVTKFKAFESYMKEKIDAHIFFNLCFSSLQEVKGM